MTRESAVAHRMTAVARSHEQSLRAALLLATWGTVNRQPERLLSELATTLAA